MENLSFSKEEFNLIWSEGAINNISFERGVSYWSGFLKKDGYIAVTCPSWFTDEHHLKVEKFWHAAGSSKNKKYYSYCRQNGAFTFNGIVKEFQEFCRQKMVESGQPKVMAWLFTRGMKRLERWKNS